MTANLPAAERADSLRAEVRDRYGKIARGGACCGGGPASDPGAGPEALVQIGYSTEELAELPEGANLGLGCGNPTALLSLRPGEVVLDLGSGAGIDCFLAAKKVGAGGRVIGVDMTPEMIANARANARSSGAANVEFRLGEIEHLPVADRSVDVVISNCVINLVPDKGEVYRDAFRVLRPGGRLAVSDVVATRPIAPAERADLALWSSCASGALEVPEVEAALRAAGFDGIEVALRVPSETPSSREGPRALGVVSADIRAVKPPE